MLPTPQGQYSDAHIIGTMVANTTTSQTLLASSAPLALPPHRSILSHAALVIVRGQVALSSPLLSGAHRTWAACFVFVFVFVSSLLERSLLQWPAHVQSSCFETRGRLVSHLYYCLLQCFAAPTVRAVFLGSGSSSPCGPRYSSSRSFF